MSRNSRWLMPVVLTLLRVGTLAAQSPAEPGGAAWEVWFAPASGVRADRPAWDASERFSVEFLGGAYLSTTWLGPGAPFDPAHPTRVKHNIDFDYAALNARIGYRPFAPVNQEGVCWWEQFPWWDHLQVLLDLETAPVLRGPGNIVIGPSLELRWDFLPPSFAVVPYVQGGTGIIYNDAYLDRSQRAIGQGQEFLLSGQLGMRCRLSEEWALSVEGGWQHISNACLAPRNGGVNNLGGSVGFTYTFGARCPQEGGRP